MKMKNKIVLKQKKASTEKVINGGQNLPGVEKIERNKIINKERK